MMPFFIASSLIIIWVVTVVQLSCSSMTGKSPAPVTPSVVQIKLFVSRKLTIQALPLLKLCCVSV